MPLLYDINPVDLGSNPLGQDEVRRFTMRRRLNTQAFVMLGVAVVLWGMGQLSPVMLLIAFGLVATIHSPLSRTNRTAGGNVMIDKASFDAFMEAYQVLIFSDAVMNYVERMHKAGRVVPTINEMATFMQNRRPAFQEVKP